MLQQRFPDRRLTVRNLAWSADEVGLQPRPQNFADVEQHLVHEKADVVFAAYGFNESFAGVAGLPAFKAKLTALVAGLKSKAFNGRSAPRVVLVSPAANENVSGVAAADLNNARIKLYADAVREVAAEQKVGFVDVFEPTREAAAGLTHDGCTLTAKGHALLAEALFKAAVGETPPAVKPAIRDAVLDKDRQFFRRYRPVNTFYYTGGRNRDYGYLDFLPAMRNFDLMVANRDRRIWDLAQGKAVPAKADDANVPPLPKAVEGRGVNEWLPAKEELKAFKVDPRFEVNLFAGEEQFPEIANPIQMRWDSRGRLWVSCSNTYPHVYPGNEPNDKLVILEDTDGDGKADKCTVFADKLNIPLSFEFGDGGVYVSEQPHLVFLKDTDGDGKADERRVVLTGFGTEDSHHALHDFTWTPDGDLLFRESVVPPLAGGDALRPRPPAEQRLVPLRPGRPPAHQLRLLPQLQPVGRDVRRLGTARRQPPGLRGGLPRPRPRLPAAAPGAKGPAGLFRRLRPRVRRYRRVPQGAAGRLHQGAVQADQPRRDPQVEGGAVRVR